MTNDRMALAELLEKGSDGDLLREMIGYVAQRLMDLDVAGSVGAEHGERVESRENWRNGFPSAAADIVCCIDRLNPPLGADIDASIQVGPQLRGPNARRMLLSARGVCARRRFQ